MFSPALGDPAKNAAAIQKDYNEGFGRWQIDRGRLTAELAARFPGDGMTGTWRAYARAVTQFYRLGAVIPVDERRAARQTLRAYIDTFAKPAVDSAPQIPDPELINWDALRRTKAFRKSPLFRRNYNRLSETLLALGEAYVQDAINRRPEVKARERSPSVTRAPPLLHRCRG